MSGDTILVTGATGLLGSEIVRLLPNAVGISSSDCDLLSKDSLLDYIRGLNRHGRTIETVIHCAARVGGVKANTDYVSDFFEDNITINSNVTSACFAKKIKLVSILSTCIYPDAPYVKYPLTEDQLHMGPPHSSNYGYAYAKRMLEVQSRAYRQQYGCNFVTVIPNNLYGPNDNFSLHSGHVIPALIRKIYEAKINNRPTVEVWGTGRAIREFTLASDAAQIILWIAETHNDNAPVNIGNTSSTSISDLAELIASHVGFSGKIIFDKSKPEGQYEKPSSNQKLKSLGWSKDYTPLSEGIRQTANSFVSQYPNVRGISD